MSYLLSDGSGMNPGLRQILQQQPGIISGANNVQVHTVNIFKMYKHLSCCLGAPSFFPVPTTILIQDMGCLLYTSDAADE